MKIISEHQNLNYNNVAHLPTLEELKNEPKNYFGLYKDEEGKCKSYYYVGLFQDKNGNFILIKPKHKADFVHMFETVLHDPIVSRYLSECYDIFPHKPWCEIDRKDDFFSSFMALHFLYLTKQLARKGLRKGYTKQTESLTNRVKGKINLKHTIKKHHIKAKHNKVVCTYTKHTSDILENRIIKSALRLCSRHISYFNKPQINQLLRQNLTSFQKISDVKITKEDFKRVRHSPFFQEYKEAIRLARLLHDRFAFTLSSNLTITTKSNKIKVPQFFIDMPELFERYVEIKLREVYKDKLWVGYKYNGFQTIIGKLRPDFLVKGEGIIIDAKYKDFYINLQNNTNELKKDHNAEIKKDLQQLALYGRTEKILNKTGPIKKHILIYPANNASRNFDPNNLNKIKDFEKFYTIGININ